MAIHFYSNSKRVYETKCNSLRLGLVQIFSIAEPVYGSAPYTAIEKKLDTQKEISGGGTETEELKAPELANETDAGFDPILDQLNGEKKRKIAPAIYSSFLHPRLQTGTITFDRKRKSQAPTPSTETGPTKFGRAENGPTKIGRAENGPTKIGRAENGPVESVILKKPKIESDRSKHKFQFI